VRRIGALSTLLFLAAVAPADEIILKTGGRLSCEVLAETRDEVLVRLPGGTMTIPVDRIEAIEREGLAQYLKREASLRRRSGDALDAVPLLERAYVNDPSDTEVRQTLIDALGESADALVRQFRFATARRMLVRLKQLDPGHRALIALPPRIAREEAQAARRYDEASEAATRGDYRRALALLEEWRVRRPIDDGEARAAMAACHAAAARVASQQGELRAAFDHFRAAAAWNTTAEIDGALYRLQPLAVLEALREGDIETARTLLDGIETTYPYASVPRFLHAVLMHVTGDVAGAVTAYADAGRMAEQEPGGRSGIDYETARRFATATLRTAVARPPQEGVQKWRELFIDPLVRDDAGTHFVVYAATAQQARSV
jgi:tetratricopeptide (TPR) repeat protein